VPDTRSHRGPHPEDARLFAEDELPRLRRATADYSWLLSRGYPETSALKLVGDRYRLTARQRVAVARVACSDQQAVRRREHEVYAGQTAGATLWLDGYNVLTTVEAALAGAVVLAGRDGTYRDMASMHGSYRKVAETRPALELIGRTCAELGIRRCTWFLDRPVSNSGRLRTILLDVAAQRGWPWDAELVNDPDPLLCEADSIVATADSVILDHCQWWYNLARETIRRFVPEARVVDLVPGFV